MRLGQWIRLADFSLGGALRRPVSFGGKRGSSSRTEADTQTKSQDSQRYGCRCPFQRTLLIGCDFQNIGHYKEFEISPQGEWVDLEVNLDLPDHTVGWQWTSGCEVAAWIDRTERVWYGAMLIPFSAIDSQTAAAGSTFRANLCRSQGPPARRKLIAWRAPMKETFHVPEKFGYLELVNT